MADNMPLNLVVVTVPISIKKRGGLKQIIAADDIQCKIETKPDGALIKAIARAFRWRKLLEAGSHATLADIAVAEKINPSYVSRIFRLTLLAPDLVEAILDGKQPSSLTLANAMSPFSFTWQEQRAYFTPDPKLLDPPTPWTCPDPS